MEKLSEEQRKKEEIEINKIIYDPVGGYLSGKPPRKRLFIDETTITNNQKTNIDYRKD